LIAALLPDVVAVATAQPGDDSRPLLPGEELLVVDAVASRKAEFTAGRTCARTALRALGIPDAPILADERRAPQWPDGAVGSITHGGGHTAAAVALRRDVVMLGIDVEAAGRLDDDDAELVAVAGERHRAAGILGSDADRLLFSAKESIYKAWYPATRRWLDFHDVTVTLEPGGTFTVDPGAHLAAGDRTILAALLGRYAVTATHVYTAVYRPA
jgi:4'-phosphopantetheinyl transferase EntD